MHTVRVRGSLAPAAGVLERGEVKTLEYSEKVQLWIDKGYVELLSEDLPPVEQPSLWDGSEPDFVDYVVTDERTDTEREADEQAAVAREEILVSAGEAEDDYAER